MTNTPDAQHFTINAMHGHDVGVWVCEGSGLGLSPVLFLQALCPDSAPRLLQVKWKHAVAPPKSFRSAGTLPLIYGEGGHLPPWPYFLHLFAPQAPVAQNFEFESGLKSSLTSSNPKRNRSLEWAKAQHLPLVIAALGYEDTPRTREQLQGRYDITEDIPIVPGPVLADVRRKAAGQTSSTLASAFEAQQITLDKELARRVMGMLYKQIEKKR